MRLSTSNKKIQGKRMIYELRTYTVKPGAVGDMVKASSTASRDIRGDDYGKLEGYWSTEIGPLNQVMHLWSYPDLERARAAARRTRQEPALDRRVHSVDPSADGAPGHSSAQRDQAAGCPASKGNVYELRNYRARPLGVVRQWLDVFTAALPAREKYSKMVGLWQTEAGQPNEVCHIWAYPSLNARAEARASAMKDPAWQEFLGKSGPMLEEMHSTIMLPAPHSPLQ